jgi:hypothetical protein
MKTNDSTTNDSGNDANRVLCPVFLFRFFFRSIFSDTNATNEELDEINIEFSDYLRKKCTEQQLQNFLPKSEIDVILNKNHPLRTNGFDPAFVLHFLQFAEIEAKKYQDSIPQI